MSSAADIYTEQEIIDNIKAIDLKLNKALSRSELDTTQSEQAFSVNVSNLRQQRDYWVQLYRCKTGNDGGIVSLQVEC
jgi:hypothetical protein